MSFTKFIKYTALFTALIFTLTAVSGCGVSGSAEKTDSGRISIVCTIFPAYDWVMRIMGDKAADADVTYLLESGTDLHNYQPTADDIIGISDCDLFIYVGGESDEWAEDAIENALNRDMKVIAMLEAVGNGVKSEELKEGMQEEEEAEGEEDEEEYDEHVWLSLTNAKVICAAIADALCGTDPGNADTYRSNLAAYTAELDALDSDFRELTSAASEKVMVFGDRFPFRYFADDYGLDYYAAFPGCSAETEASFETIVFLAQKMDELGCRTIYTTESGDGSVARTIVSNTQAKDQTVAQLNSLQSVSRQQADSGATYISLMRANYEVLRSTLS